MQYQDPYEPPYLYVVDSSDLYRLEKLVRILEDVQGLKMYALFFNDIVVTRRCVTSSIKEVFKEIRNSVFNNAEFNFTCGMVYGIMFSLSFFKDFAIDCENEYYRKKKALKNVRN